MTLITKKTLFASTVAMALGAANAEAALVTNVLGAYTFSATSPTKDNFTMLASNGGVVGGSNYFDMTWDGNAFNSSSDYTGPGGTVNASINTHGSSVFFGYMWTAHDIQMFVPGNYSFDTALGGGNAEFGTQNVVVPTGQLGMHMLFDWNGNNNIDVFMVFAQNSIFGSGLLYSTQKDGNGQLTCSSSYTGTIKKNCLYDGYLYYQHINVPTINQIWMLASTDGNGDGVMGIPMASGGPFAGFNWNFNVNLTATPKPVPLPAALWLFGSGVMGLFGIAKRRKR